MQPASKQSKLPLYAALGANMAIAIIKFVASRISGSSAMLSESIHSAVDCANSLLILRGIKRSKRPADEAHPFGHGKEIYYYTLIVSIMVFTLGGGLSLYEGISHLQHPEALQDPLINYIVLGSAILFEGASLVLALRKFIAVKGPLSFWTEVRLSKDPSLFAVIYEDIAAMIGLVIALLGVFLSHYFHSTLYDGLASILIGGVLCTTAGIMLWETRSLLVGESADSAVVKGIFAEVKADPDVKNLQTPLTMQMSPNDILVALDVQFNEQLGSLQIVTAINRLENSIRKKFPDVCHIFIEARNLAHIKT